MIGPVRGQNLLWPIWLGYVAFVVYGSLVPLDFRALPVDRAWADFADIPMYRLGIESRADWIANGVLYVPVGFLTLCLLRASKADLGWMLPMTITALFSLALALGIEFAQVFFPPRTVSLNDLLAEGIGSVVGLLLARRHAAGFRSLLQSFVAGPAPLQRRLPMFLLHAYLAGHVAFSLFPFDLLLSAAEVEGKLQGEKWGWLIAGEAHGRFMIGLKLILEVVLTLPFGFLLGHRSAGHARPRPERRGTSILPALAFGLLLGGFIETAQFFTASGVSQGASVLTRIAGVCGGLLLWRHRAEFEPERLAMLVRRYALPLIVAYLFVLLQANGWLSSRWSGIDHAVLRFDELHFLPFYYHYYTTEARALFSLASVCLMYLPLALLTWCLQGSPAQAGYLAVAVAAVIEAGKLFLQGMHADPTNILLAGSAAWAGTHLANTLSRVSSHPLAVAAAGSATPCRPAIGRAAATSIPAGTSSAGAGSAAALAERGAAGIGTMCLVLLLPVLGFVAYRSASFPAHAFQLSLFLVACSAVLWHRPQWLAALIPAALPVLDLAPWSGRFYFDEFDLLLIAGIGIAYCRIPEIPAPPAVGRRQPPGQPLLTAVGGLLAVALVIGVLRGLLPWQAPDASSFTHYYSPFNALRIGKGALAAFLFWGLLRRMAARGVDIRRLLAIGMVAGLALTVTVILFERLSFAGLLDFASDYRVTGPFSSMHTGGAYIECFLATATPFLLLEIIRGRSLAERVGGALLLLASTYALMITFSRNGYAAYGFALTLFLFLATFRAVARERHSRLVLLLAAAMLAIALPVLDGQFARERMAGIGRDYDNRKAHWLDALAMRTPTLATTLFGMGLGRYPESNYLLGNEGRHAGTHQLKAEAENRFLRLGPGDPIYVEQIVAVTPGQSLMLKLDLRSTEADATISVSLCEKWMLTSSRCVRRTVAADQGAARGGDRDAAGWRQVELAIDPGAIGRPPWSFGRPVKFALHNPAGNFQVDVDNLRLENESGENLLDNGSFSRALDRWFFSADNHLQWHAKSLPVAVLFDLGWFGLVAVAVFSVFALSRAGAAAWRGDLDAAAALAAFAGFLVVGLFDTLLDAPRFLLLFVLLGLYCGSTSGGVAKNA